MTEQHEAVGSKQMGYGSLDEAFVHRRVPVENRAFIRSLLNRTPVAGLARGEDCMIVLRSDGGPSIHVYRGYSSGFRSAEEIISVVGDAPRWPSARFPGTWAVDHPAHGAGSAAETLPVAPPAARPARRAAAPKAAPKPKADVKTERVQPVCHTCFMLMAMSGVCGNCE